MELFISFIWLGLSLTLLIWGANKFIDTASLIAGKFGISDFIIGLSIIALGTSFPEIFVGISAIVNNNEELALGAIVGSNISNIALIFGISLIGYSTSIKPSSTKNFIAVFASAAMAVYTLKDLSIDPSESIILLIILIYFIYVMAYQPDINNEAPKSNDDSNLLKLFTILTLGLIGLVIGANYAVVHGEKIALIIGIPELIVGLTVLAIGTSLPELAVTIGALVKKKNEMVLGNIIGSNVLNIVIVMPILGFFSSQTYDEAIISRDLLVMSFLTIIFILIALSFNLKNIPAYAYRITGVLLASGYIYYIGNLANFF